MTKETLLRHCVYNKLNGARYFLAFTKGELPEGCPYDPRTDYGTNFFELVEQEILILKRKPKHIARWENMQNQLESKPLEPVVIQTPVPEESPNFTLYWVADDNHESSWFVLTNIGGTEMSEFIHTELNDECQLGFWADEESFGYSNLECHEVMSNITLDKLDEDTILYSKQRFVKYKADYIGERGKEFIELMNDSFVGQNFQSVDAALQWTGDTLKYDHKKDAIHWNSEHHGDTDYMNEVCCAIDAMSHIQHLLKNCAVYAPVIIDLELLESLGFKILDDGFVSDRRMVLYNEALYIEGSMIVEVVKQLMM